jgi:hypothetical protein
MTCSTSDVAVCCSNASRNSRLSRATSDSELSAAERRLLRVFGAFRPFGLSALRGRALAGVWPALERLFIASTRMSAQGIVAGHSNTGHGTRAHPTLSRAAARPAQPHRRVVFSWRSTRRQTHPAASLRASRPCWKAGYVRRRSRRRFKGPATRFLVSRRARLMHAPSTAHR